MILYLTLTGIYCVTLFIHWFIFRQKYKNVLYRQ